MEVRQGESVADVRFSMRHLFGGVCVRLHLPRFWQVGITGVYYHSKATTVVSAITQDSTGWHSGHAYEETPYVRDPFRFDNRRLLAEDRYVPYQLGMSLGKHFRLNERHSFSIDAAAGIMPVSSAKIVGYSIKDPRDSTWFLANVNSSTDGFFNPFISITTTGSRFISEKSSLFVSLQFLMTMRAFYDRTIEVDEKARIYNTVTAYRHLAWFAISIGYGFRWGVPVKPRDRKDLRERAPYWPGGT